MANHPYYDNVIRNAVFFTVEDMRLSKMHQMLQEGEKLDLDISDESRNDLIIPYSVVNPELCSDLCSSTPNTTDHIT